MWVWWVWSCNKSRWNIISNESRPVIKPDSPGAQNPSFWWASCPIGFITCSEEINKHQEHVWNLLDHYLEDSWLIFWKYRFILLSNKIEKWFGTRIPHGLPTILPLLSMCRVANVTCKLTEIQGRAPGCAGGTATLAHAGSAFQLVIAIISCKGFGERKGKSIKDLSLWTFLFLDMKWNIL